MIPVTCVFLFFRNNKTNVVRSSFNVYYAVQQRFVTSAFKFTKKSIGLNRLLNDLAVKNLFDLILNYNIYSRVKNRAVFISTPIIPKDKFLPNASQVLLRGRQRRGPYHKRDGRLRVRISG